ncbi:T9SS type A sorting domain-containing protein [Anaerophaga thermohalophila]|uniref:T9SS type A sorting domain-containing protein n=1 Tax=Anaerophaga thermohalophila TaxID=177400 RepID=UPI000237C434|nr:T9SS type A sorting domain-containing protein [Anaerophaga thermohalophila]
MKRFTTLMMVLFFFTAAFAQTEVVVEELWNDSKYANGGEDPLLGVWADGDAPSWMGSTTERGMAQIDDKIYIPSRNGGSFIVVLDALTGSQLGTITLPTDPVSGGTFPINSIAKTASGNLLICNLAANTQAVEDPEADPVVPTGQFKVYHIELNAAGDNYTNITTVVNWHNYGDTEHPAFRLGDGIAFYGDVADGSKGYLITAAASSDFVLRWDVTNGTFETDPTIFQLADSNPPPADGDPVNLGTAPQCFAYSDNLVIIDGKDLFPAVYDMTGQMIATFGEQTPIQGNGNGVAYFTLEGRSFVVCSSTVWTTTPSNAFQLFELVNGNWEEAVSIAMLPAEGLSSSGVSNSSFIYPVAVDVVGSEAYVYVMAANSGIAGFKVTLAEGTAIGDKPMSDISLYPNPATEVIHFSEEMVSVKVYDMTGKLVKEVLNTNRLEVSELKGIYLINAVDNKGNILRNKVVIQ